MAAFPEPPAEVPPTAGRAAGGPGPKYRSKVLLLIVGGFLIAHLVAPSIGAALSVGRSVREFFEGMAFIDADSATVWRGDVWCIASGRPGAMGLFPGADGENHLLRLAAEGNVSEYVPPPGEVRLVAQDDRLWIISRDGVETYDGKGVTPLPFSLPPGRALEPFRLGGRLAVPLLNDGVCTIHVFGGDGWHEVGAFELPDSKGAEDVEERRTVRMAELDGEPVVFLEWKDELYTYPGLPPSGTAFPDQWHSLGRVGHPWDVATVDGRPLLVSADASPGTQPARLLGRVLDGAGLREVFSDQSAGMMLALAVIPQESGGATILVQNSPWMTTLRRYERGQLVQSSRSQGPRFPLDAYAITLALDALPYMIAILVAAGLGRLMEPGRIAPGDVVGENPMYASPLQRGMARMVDSLVMGWPFLLLLVLLGRMFSAPDAARLATRMTFAVLLAIGGFLWLIVTFVLFSVAEGLWGRTPGKWIFGIRVASADLGSLGFGRALLRNALLAIDGLVKGFVGLTLIALTPRRQRLGDMAARSIVVRDKT